MDEVQATVNEEPQILPRRGLALGPVPEVHAATEGRLLPLRALRVERDYVLNHILAHMSTRPGTRIFRGGTALARGDWPDFRLSEDLDFIKPVSGEDIEGIERSAVRRAQETGIELSLDFVARRSDRSRSIVDWTTDWGSAGSLLIDVVRGEKPALPEEDRGLNLPYSDPADDRVLPVLPLADILGSKWDMLDERDEPRDLFDVRFALRNASVPFELSLPAIGQGTDTIQARAS